VAGGVNSLAGGGTLISFPVLVALGLPAVSANVTNTVALSPGYFGGVLSQRRAMTDQAARIRRLAVVAGIGGLAGSILLLLTSNSAFRLLIPALLFAATLLLAGQDRIRNALHIGGAVSEPVPTPAGTHPADPRWLVIPVLLVSVYGGYFGAGLGIMLLAVLGIVLHDSLARLNAVKQVLALVINATAALLFLTSHKVYWVVALVMAVTSLLGGNVGGRLAGSIKPARLRLVVLAIGTAVSIAYAVKTWL
jgi:uncharacterized membrane protein YfcA